MSREEVASWILKFSERYPHEARNAYSCLMLVPGCEHIHFTQIIKKCKAAWENSGPKYGDFWDAKKVLHRLLQEPLDWRNVAALRDPCLLVLRLLHLCRSVDLARSYRRCSRLGDRQYWCLHRKRQRRPRWEPLISLTGGAGFESVCPRSLLNAYVALTARFANPSGRVFLSLKAPYKPLSAQGIGRVTKKELARLGIPVKVFGAHSTRGAAVKMFKSLGVSSEVVCELGGGRTPRPLRLIIYGWGLPPPWGGHMSRVGAQRPIL